jgi:hypothetical protein
MPVVNTGTLNGSKYVIFYLPVVPIHFPDQILDILPLGFPIHLAWTRHGDQAALPDESPDFLFLGVNQWPDQVQLRPLQVCYRREGMDTPFVKSTEQHGFYGIILMMGKGHLVAVELFCHIIQGTSPKIGTQGTGIRLLSGFKHDLSDEGLLNRVAYADFFAELPDRRQIKLSDPHGQGNSFEFKLMYIEPLQLPQCHKE